MGAKEMQQAKRPGATPGQRNRVGPGVQGVAQSTPARPKESVAMHAGAGHVRVALRVQRARAPGVGVAVRACTLWEALEAEANTGATGQLRLVLGPVAGVAEGSPRRAPGGRSRGRRYGRGGGRGLRDVRVGRLHGGGGGAGWARGGRLLVAGLGQVARLAPVAGRCGVVAPRRPSPR